MKHPRSDERRQRKEVRRRSAPAAGDRPNRYARRRAATLLGVYVLMAIHIMHWRLAGRTLAPLELNEVMYTLELGIVTAGFVFMLAAVLATAIFGRFFCSWGCHILALQDASAWLLQRVGIRPKPVRSRVLRFVPLLAMLYMFAWPQVWRLLSGGSLPDFHVATDAQGWASFMTTNFWRNLPGPGVAVLTFLVCGFLIVYALGTRAFCTYGCPYGAVFNLADRIAPGRIVAAGDCSNCGRCTAVCQSRVRVHEEVRTFGKVVNSSCLKDLDCVSACPTGALRFGFTLPTVISPGPMRHVRRLAYDFSYPEDICMAVVFVISLLVFRGLYGVVPFLLTLAIASILAYGTVICLRLWRAGRVRLNNLELKAANRVTKTGFIFLTLAGGMGCLLLHSALVRYHEFRGMRSFQRVHAMADGGLTVAGHPEYASAIRHHGFLEKWSLVRSIELSRRQAALCLMGLDGAGAERHLGRILARMPGDVDARLGWVRAKLLGGRVPEARSALGALSGISLAGAGDTETRRVRVEIDELKAQVALATGDLESAILAYQAALAVTGPGHQSARIHGAIGELFAGRGELTAALEHMEIAVAGRPNSSAAHYNLAVVLGAAGRLSESEEHYRRAIELDPTDVEPVNNLGMLLAGRGDLDSADERFRAAIALRADFAPAHFNHARVLVARGKWEEARQHLVRAAQLDARFAEFTSSGMLPPF